ncbi:MAG: translation initiation factor IF-3 [Ignavibacteriaceae bacterium]|nr:translation initiation factor IF-3 [Ignavibacteriaceae bacterium]
MAQKEEVRVNEEIKSLRVRVIDIDGTQLGIFSVKDALRKAQERGQDLVEIAPQAQPPVCKIINFGKFRYELQKKEKIQRKHQQVTVLKEIRLHPNTDTHDFEFKVRHAIGFLEDGNKVKVAIIFKGREMAYVEQGESLMNQFIERTADVSKVEAPMKMEGKNLLVILAPQKSKGKKQTN